MDTFETNEFPEENEIPVSAETPVPEEPEVTQEQPASQPESAQAQPEPTAEAQPEPQVQQNVYHGAGAGRKESPYANSPYVMNQTPRQENSYQPPQYHYQPQTEPQGKPKKETKARKPIWKGIVAAVLVAAMVAGGCLITAASVNDYWEDRTEDVVEQMNNKITELQQRIDDMSRSTGASVSGSTVASGEGMTPGQIYAQCVDSVVAISCTSTVNYYGQTAEGTSSGSGFILTENGYVVTNYHVVEGASSISVITNEGTEYEASLVGYDSGNDVAVLKVEATGLPAVTLGSSNDLVIGDMVVAIGNPLGELTSTQTVGYVSGKDRDVTTDNTIINMIQTDAAINPGNSGGPLFNMKGEVVGITTAKYSGTTTSGASIEGIGFAIPIDDVVGMISDLMDYGYVTGPYLGVTVQNVDAESASFYGLPTEGAYVVSVVEGVAADRAGVQPKDIILELGGYEVSTITDLTRALRNFKAGDTTTITVFRSGAEMVLDITLDEKPQDMSTATVPGSGDPSMPSEGSYDEWYEWFFGNGGGNGG